MAKKGKPRRKGKQYDRIIGVGIVVTLLVIGFVLWGPLHKAKPPRDKGPAQTEKVEKTREQPAVKTGPHAAEKKSGRDERPATKEAPASPAQHEQRALVAIVIDDLGQDVKQAREILSLPARITIAVLPGLAQSQAIAELTRQNNRELLLHLPMEYRSKNGKPAPGMLSADMTPMDFLATLSNNMASVPGAIGVNNHEGSSLTENKEAMKFLMAELKARDLLFLDSLTTPKSVAYSTAREFGLRAARRDVFLDNDSENAASIQKQLEELARVAKNRGRAIGIGHPHPATIAELRRWIPTAAEQGIEIVPLSRVLQ